MSKEKHGHAGTKKNGKWVTFPSPTYVSWEGMRRRVTPVHTEHKHYTHVKVCERWNSFLNFLEDMGERPEGLTLDRIDTNGNYCKENCRWATWSEQNKNRRRFVRKIDKVLTFNGKTMKLSEWSSETGIKKATLARRIKAGWSVENTLLVATRPARRSIVKSTPAN